MADIIDVRGPSVGVLIATNEEAGLHYMRVVLREDVQAQLDRIEGRPTTGEVFAYSGEHRVAGPNGEALAVVGEGESRMAYVVAVLHDDVQAQLDRIEALLSKADRP